ncbi:Uncharacterised protein [Klebsiella pneumoniae]|uniref:Uncharacterized protein n=1 Tax=Klebsiella pneumoniae TaxID=573 RepID=A0A377W3L6_KLEPN|nr:Uncharacterised protein [Klebsiella pneumoniae]
MQAQATDLDTRPRHARVSAAALRLICQNCASRRVAVVKISLSSVIRASLPRCCHTVSNSASRGADALQIAFIAIVADP